MSDQDEFSKPYTFGQQTEGASAAGTEEFRKPYGTSPRMSRVQPQTTAPAVLTPSMEHAARAEALVPAAEQQFQQNKAQDIQADKERQKSAYYGFGEGAPPPPAGQSFSITDVPVLGNLTEKGISWAASKYPESRLASWWTGGNQMGDTEEERYKNMLAYQDAYRQRQYMDDPTSYYGARVMGGLSVPLPSLKVGSAVEKVGEKVLAPVAEQMPSILEKGFRLVGRPVPAAIEGGVWTGADVAAGAAPDSSAADVVQDVKKGVEEGAKTGYLFGLPVSAGMSIGKYGAGVTRAIWDPEGYAASEIAKANAGATPKEKLAGLSPEKASEMSAQGLEVLPYDIAGAKAIGRDAASSVAPVDPDLVNLNNQIVERYNNRSANVQQDVYKASGRGTNPQTGQPYTDFELRNLAEDEARRVNGPAYKAAYSAPSAQAIWNDDLQRLVNTPGGSAALQKTIGSSNVRAARDRMDPLNPFYRDQSGQWQLNQNVGVPNLEFWDRFKRNMNDIVEGQKDRYGKHTTESLETQSLLYGDAGAARGAGLTPYQNQFSLVPFLKTTVPEYDTALRGSQRYIKEDNAFDAGKNFLDIANVGRKSSNILEADKKLQDFAKYSPSEQNVFRQGLLANITENPSQAAKIFGGGDAKTLDRYRQVLGDKMFDEVDNTMRMHRISSVADVLSGSAPKDRMNLTGAIVGTGMGGAGLIVWGKDILEQALQNPLITAATAGAGAVAGTGYVVKKAIDKAMIGKKTEAVLKMLGTGDQATFQKILNAAKTDKQISLALKNIEYGISRVAALQSQNSPKYTTQQAPQQAGGGRIGRDSGGRTNGSAASKAARLIAQVDHIRKGHGKDTSSLLNLDDDTVAKALAIANQKI